ncbi:hypothetical protein GEMRC1_005417 [Eukaryota sp. GEM-RC1]
MEFEANEFQSPDFNSLDVICFNTTGLPAGINLPNFNDIKENYGFKNVSLSNVLSAPEPRQKMFFISDSDQELLFEFKSTAFKVQVAVHEQGHGTGKLWMKNNDETFNFDRSVKNPVTGGDCGFYDVGQSYDSVIGKFSSPMEECRAECIALYLSTFDNVLEMFQIPSENLNKVRNAMFLNLCRGASHIYARWVILSTLMKAGIASISKSQNEEGFELSLDFSRLCSDGRKVIGELLLSIHVARCTADREAGVEIMTSHLPNPEEINELRNKVIEFKRPRPFFVQPKLLMNELKNVELVNFEANLEGYIKSIVAKSGFVIL